MRIAHPSSARHWLLLPAVIASALLAGPLHAVEAPYAPDDHTVLLLHFDEGTGEAVADASRSGLRVQLLPPPRRPEWHDDGMFGKCFHFDGVNVDEDGDGRGDADALWLKDEGKLQPAEGLTVEAWVKPERGDRNQGIVSRSGGARYCLFLYGTAVYFSMQVTRENKLDWARVRADNVISVGEWQHVAVTYDGERLREFVNGHQVAETEAPGTPTTGEAVTMIGCDTDSRPIDSAIRGFCGLIDEVRISNIARTELNVSATRTAATREALQAAATRPRVERPKYPDPPTPPVNERHVVVAGRVLDETGKPLPGALVSDGEHVARTDARGRCRLSLDIKDLRFVFATRPRGRQPIGPWYVPLERDETQTDYAVDFTFAPDPLSDRDLFTFLAGGDTQFSDLTTFAELLEEYDQLTRMSGEPGFFTVAGDLTMSGTQWEMDRYKEVAAKSHLDLHNCFGGHDGNYARAAGGQGSVYHYQRNLGPAWYSWDYGPVHFATYVSETSFLTARQQQLQSAWLDADLAAQPAGTPIVLVTHVPPTNEAVQSWLDRGHTLVGVIYGHWHLVNVCGYRHVPYLDTGPLRGHDWGAFSRVFRVVRFENGKLSSEVRVCGQVKRLDVVSPQGEVGRGRVPVQIKAYDTIRRVARAECQIAVGEETLDVRLRQTGAWTWEGGWDSNRAPAGEAEVRVSVTDEKGGTWQRTERFRLADRRLAAVRLSTDWPTFFREGHSRVRDVPLAPPLQLAWVVNTGGRHQKAVSPIVYRDRVYVGVDCREVGHPGAGVSCFNADGRRLWHADTDSSVCFAPAAVEGRVYAVSSYGSCYAFVANTGRELWRSQPFGPPDGHRLVRCCPVLHEGELLLMADGGTCPVLDAATGQTKRTLSLGGSLTRFSFPSVHNGRVYGGLRQRAVAHDLATGEPLWGVDIASGKIASTPVPHRGRVYVNASTMTCLAEATGEKLWQQPVPTSGNGISVAVPAGDLVLANGSSLRAFDAETGVLRWQHSYAYAAEVAKRNQRQVYAGQSTPLVAGEVVYVGSDDGHLYAFALSDGQVLWKYDLGVPIKGSPVLSGNALLVSDWDGNLFCLVSP